MSEFTQPWMAVMSGIGHGAHVDDLLRGILTAAVGAVAGALLSWLAQHRLERGRSRRDLLMQLQAKLHELELRIVKVEAENHAFVVTAARSPLEADRA